jgi:type III secretion protein SpaR/YscT/HrcT
MEAYATLLLLSFCRVFGFMKMMPHLAELKLPQGTKMVVFASITPFVAIGQDAQTIMAYQLPFLAAKEVIIGLFLGFFVALPFKIPQMIGDLVDNQRGAAVNSQYNPATGDESSVLGTLLTLTAVTYFYTEGGMDKLITILASSFALQSAYSFSFGFGEHFVDVAFVLLNNCMQLFAILALPMVLVMMMVDVSLGYTSKFAQSLNAFSLSQPIKAFVALSMLITIHPKIIDAIMQMVNKTVETLL